MLSESERQLVVFMLNDIMNTTQISAQIEQRRTMFEFEEADLLRAISVCDYSADKVQKSPDPDSKMINLVERLEKLRNKFYKDIEPLIRRREKYLAVRAYIVDMHYPYNEIMESKYIAHKEENIIRHEVGLNIKEYFETIEEGIELIANFLLENGYSPEGD